MKRLWVFLLIFFTYFLVQSISIAYGAEWAKSYGTTGDEIATFIQETSDGGYIVAGHVFFLAENSTEDFLVMKLDSKGNIVWQKTFGGESADIAESIQQTIDGGYIVTGYSGGDFLVIKLDANGNVVWQKTYGGENDDYPRSIQQTSDGGYIVAGHTAPIGTVGADALVIKLNANGNIVWQKTYGGERDDFARSIQQTKDGGYIVAGFRDTNERHWDVWIFKLDSNGTLIWEKIYGETGFDYAKSIQQTSDGGYIVAGHRLSFEIGVDEALVLKLDSNGNIVWQKTYGGELGYYVRSIQQTNDGGYIMAGYTYSFRQGPPDIWAVKLDNNGNIVWQKTYVGSFVEGYGASYGEAYSVKQTEDGGYIIAGKIWSSNPDNAWDVLVLKLNSEGNIPMCGYIYTTNATTRTPNLTGITQSTFALSTNFLGINFNGTAINSNLISLEECYFPLITVLRPNGGQHWNAGGSYVIKWDASSEAVKFKLFYSTDNQTTWNLIKGVGNVRQYKWTIPAQDGKKPKSFEIGRASCRERV